MARPLKPKPMKPAKPAPQPDLDPHKVAKFKAELTPQKMKSIIDSDQASQFRLFSPLRRNPSVLRHFDDFAKKYPGPKRKR